MNKTRGYLQKERRCFLADSVSVLIRCESTLITKQLENIIDGSLIGS